MPKSGKQRLDVLLVQRGMAESRQKAQAMIMAGQVYIKDCRMDKAGATVDEHAVIELHGKKPPYVSRGGLKLERALTRWPIALNGAICVDIGASTGGFTDCMLQHGASKVYAIDSGYNQLDWRLRTDERVICMERTNARYLTREQLPELLDFASVDVSFISLRLILPPLRPLVKEGAAVVCLIKPQFEAGRERVGKKGVVRDASTHCDVLEQFLMDAKQAEFSVLDLTYSPVKGPEGNIEFLGYLYAGGKPMFSGDLREVVTAAHENL